MRQDDFQRRAVLDAARGKGQRLAADQRVHVGPVVEQRHQGAGVKEACCDGGGATDAKHQPFGKRHYRAAVHVLEELAWQTDKSVVLAGALVDELRRQAILLPTLLVIERICAEAITRGNRRIYRALNEPLVNAHRRRLDDLLKRRPDSKKTRLQWARQSPGRPNSRHMLEHIERLKYLQAVDLPDGIGRSLHQNRLLKLAREGGQMRAAELAKFEPQRRYATLVALAVEGLATVTDEIVDLHDRILGRIFNAAKQRHQQQFQEAGKAINDKVRLYSKIGRALGVDFDDWKEMAWAKKILRRRNLTGTGKMARIRRELGLA